MASSPPVLEARSRYCLVLSGSLLWPCIVVDDLGVIVLCKGLLPIFRLRECATCLVCGLFGFFACAEEDPGVVIFCFGCSLFVFESLWSF